jgi:hypothetical protein
LTSSKAGSLGRDLVAGRGDEREVLALAHVGPRGGEQALDGRRTRRGGRGHAHDDRR